MKRTITILMTICMLLTSITFGQLSANAKETVPKSKIKSVSLIDTTTLKIKWQKVKSISKYELFYKVSGGKFKKLATLSKNTTSYTHKRLMTNKKYFYKIRTYKTVRGKKYYSSFSNQMGKKITNYLIQIIKPYFTDGYTEYTNGKTMKMGGVGYTNGFVFYWYHSNAIFNLKGKYKSISFICGNIDGDSNEGTLYIYSDDNCVKTISIKEGDLPKRYAVDIEDASKLEFKIESSVGYRYFGVADIKVYK